MRNVDILYDDHRACQLVVGRGICRGGGQDCKESKDGEGLQIFLPAVGQQTHAASESAHIHISHYHRSSADVIPLELPILICCCVLMQDKFITSALEIHFQFNWGFSLTVFSSLDFDSRTSCRAIHSFKGTCHLIIRKVASGTNELPGQASAVSSGRDSPQKPDQLLQPFLEAPTFCDGN